MEENNLIIENKGLIYLAIKEEHLYWKTQDEYQDFIDAGYDGLLNGIRTYNKDLGIKPSTYYYSCIKHEMIKVIQRKELRKNSIKTVSLNKTVGQDEIEELIDLIPDEVDLEQELQKQEQNERLHYLVDHLPKPKDRLVIKMIFGLDGWEQMSASEIARRWGVNKNTIIQRKNRALRKLWFKMQKEDI